MCPLVLFALSDYLRPDRDCVCPLHLFAVDHGLLLLGMFRLPLHALLERESCRTCCRTCAVCVV